MIEEGPDPKEVASFHFVQLRTLKLVKNNEQASKDFINAIATASKFGLLFVGITNGFKVLKLENVLDLDEDKENKSIEENYFSQVVPCESPVLLSLSTDQKTLAVCVGRNSKVVVDFYDIAAFADHNAIPTPFQNAQLSSNSCKLKEFLWNPVSDGIFAYCLSDGSLGVQELIGMNLSQLANLPNVGATAACWSPKGKQLVVGKRDGSFSQYKPNLQEVKIIPIPNMGEKLMVANICWLSTTQFAVLYMPPGSGISPYLFIVSTPKGSPVVYTNYYDVCLGNSTNDSQRYFLHHEPAWDILVCASTDSIEVGVLGNPPSWVQWDLREDGRILLPAKNGARCAVGAGVMYCAQRRIVISENESYPPMPIMFFLTDNGLLVSYHMVNTAPGCTSLVRPSTPIDRTGERKRAGGTQKIGNTVAASHVMPSISKIPATNVIPSVSFAQTPAMGSMNAAAFSTGSLAFGLSQANSQQSFQSTPQIVNVSNLAPSSVPSSSIQFGAPSSMNMSSEMERFHKLSKGVVLVPPTQTVARDNSGVRHMAVAQRSVPDVKGDGDRIIQSNSAIPNTKVTQIQAPPSNSVMAKDSFHSQDTYRIAIVEEMQTFEKEIQELKKSSEQLGTIGTKEEMAQLKSFTMNFEEFNNDMADTMVSLNNDIHSLKNILLESFVLVEQAHSKERRKNDHSYISMLRERALDPLTAKRMQKIEQHHLYLSTQLQEVNNKLDQDWFEYLEKKKANQRSIRHISSAEAMYKTVVNNQKIIHNLRQLINSMSNQLVEKRLQNLSKRKNKTEFIKRSGPEELSKLADAFLQAKITNSEEEKLQLPKKMPFSAQQALKNYLSNSPVTVVRPTIVSSPAQSRLLSKSLLFKESIISPTSNETDTAVNIQQTIDRGAALKSAAIIKPGLANSPTPFVSLNEINQKNFISINKPQVTSALDFDKLRQQNVESSFGNHGKEENFTKPVPKLVSSTIQLISPKLGNSPISAEEIPSPVYEDITPPDSPAALNINTINASPTPENEVILISMNEGAPEVVSGNHPFPVLPPTDNKVLQVSFNKEAPKLMSGDPGIQRSGLSENPKEHQNISQRTGKPTHSFFQTENKPLPFAAFSASNVPPNVKLPSGDHNSGTKISTNNASHFNAEERQSSSQVIKPNTVKPMTSFSFFPPSTAVPNFAIPTSKNEGNEVQVSQSDKSLPQTPKLVFDLSNKQSPKPVSVTLFTTNSANLEKKEGPQSIESEKSPFSNLLSSEATSEKSKTVNPLQQPTSFIPTTVSKTSSFFKTTTPKTTSASLTFFQSTAGSTTASQQDVSSDGIKTSPSGLTITSVFSQNVTTSASTIQTSKTVDVSKSEESQVTSSSSSSSISSISSQSAFSQAPMNLTKKTQSSEEKPAVSTSAEETNVPSSIAVTQPTVQSSFFNSKPPTTSVFGQGTAPLSSGFLTSSAPSPPSQQSSVTPTNATMLTFEQPTSPAVTSEPAQTISSVPNPPAATSQASPSSTVFPAAATTTPQTTTASSVFPVTATTSQTTSASTVFSVASTTSQPLPMFGQANSSIFSPSPNVVISTASVSTPANQPVFGQANSTASSFFGQIPASQSTFGQTVTTQSSFFGKPATETPVFGQASPFGSTTQTNSFTQSGGSFFSPTSTGQTSVFGSNASGNSAFGNQSPASNFSFGKSAFGETQGSFGLAKSVFGQQNPSTFGTPVSSPSSTPFGQSSGGSLFGQGSFFSGLGGQPSAENANKNVFSMGNLGKPSSDSGSVFGGASTFGSKVNAGAFGSGSFSSGGGSVAQTGFGAFQQTPQKPGGFGASPAFGGAPAFGSSPAFGSPPAFGSGSPLGSVFGSQGGAQAANFSSFASSNTPTFGSLASQSTGSFGQQQTPFGGGSVFGGAPSFGGSPGFGGSSGPTASSSAFTQWRS